MCKFANYCAYKTVIEIREEYCAICVQNCTNLCKTSVQNCCARYENNKQYAVYYWSLVQIHAKTKESI